jgi:phosphomannomutase
MPANTTEQRTCPGERYSISPAICRTRQRNQYPKCLLCAHRDAEIAGAMSSDPKVKASIFRATAVLGHVPEEINEYVIRKVGLAAAQYLRAQFPSGSSLAVACDLRDNSRGFTRIFCEGANRGGMDTVNVGTVPPEVLAFALGTDGCTGAAFIGGGNYADNVNGVRIWRRDGSIVGFGGGLEKIGLIASRLRTGCSRLPGEMKSAGPLTDYVPYVRKFAPKLEPLRVLVEGGYGAAGRLFGSVCVEMPIELIHMHPETDGHNPFLGRQFPCADVVASVKANVRRHGADLGIALDFPGEKVVFFDERGDVLRHDVAAGMIAREVLARNPEATVTYDVRSTAALRAAVVAAGGKAIPAPTGRLPFAQHFRRNDSHYGADLDGLHYFKDFFRFPSPVVALLMMCSHLSRERKACSELASDLSRLRQSGEITIDLPSADMAEGVLNGVKEEFAGAEKEMIDGLTVRQADWWFNLRQRGESAELRLNVEARTDRELRRARQQIERLVARLIASEAA